MSVYGELEMTVGHVTDWTKQALDGAIAVVDAGAVGVAPVVAAVVNAPGAVLGTTAKGVGKGLSYAVKMLKSQRKP